MGGDRQKNYTTKLRPRLPGKGLSPLRPLRALHKAVVVIEPWGIILAVFGFVISIAGFILELDDRQSERTFRAWEVILSSQGQGNNGSSVRKALEYLNREFDGRFCGEWGRSVSSALSGNNDRACLLPKKKKESFANVDLNKAILSGVNLSGADLRGAGLSGTDLSGANLSGARGLKKAQLALACADPLNPPALPDGVKDVDIKACP